MNDIANHPIPTESVQAGKEKPSASLPDADEFERFASMFARDLRRAQTEEITRTAKSHFVGGGDGSPGTEHDQKGTELLEDLGKKHMREQFTFRASIGKLRSYYASAHERTAQDGPTRVSNGPEKTSDFDRSR